MPAGEPDMDDAATALTVLADESDATLARTISGAIMYNPGLSVDGDAAATAHDTVLTEESPKRTITAAGDGGSAAAPAQEELLLQELNEHGVSGEPGSQSLTGSMNNLHDWWSPSADQIRSLAARGIHIRRGAWSKLEERTCPPTRVCVRVRLCARVCV